MYRQSTKRIILQFSLFFTTPYQANTQEYRLGGTKASWQEHHGLSNSGVKTRNLSGRLNYSYARQSKTDTFPQLSPKTTRSPTMHTCVTTAIMFVDACDAMKSPLSVTTCRFPSVVPIAQYLGPLAMALNPYRIQSIDVGIR